jgi:hypothetical protein
VTRRGRPQTVVGHGAFNKRDFVFSMSEAQRISAYYRFHHRCIENTPKNIKSWHDQLLTSLNAHCIQNGEHVGTCRLRFENGYETSGVTSERDEIEGNQET